MLLAFKALLYIIRLLKRRLIAHLINNLMKKIFYSASLIIGGVAALVPTIALAANAGDVGSGIIGQAQTVTNAAGNLATDIGNALNIVIGVLITLAVVVFIFNIVRFLLIKDPAKQADIKKYLFWSIIAIAVIIGIFGIARLLLDTFGANQGALQSYEVPHVNV
jgi:hypothetical protein